MKKLWVMLSFFLIATATAQPAKSEVFRIRFENATIAPTEAGGSAAIRALIVNPTSITTSIMGARTPMAGETILQRYTKDKTGLVQLTPVDELILPSNDDVVLAPGALELQLVGLTAELQAGLELPLTIKFADGTERVIRIRVEE